MNGPTEGTRTLCALLVDLENLYLAIKDQHRNPNEVTLAVLQNLRTHLKDELGITPVVGRGYGPMDYSLSRHMINDIALMGITPVHVLARASKNSADLMLAIDAMEILFSRPDITTFVIVGGDRDYIPVVERIRQNARGVLVVSPRHAMSGDLLTIIGKECYLDTDELLPEVLRKQDEPVAPVVSPAREPEPEPETLEPEAATSETPEPEAAEPETATSEVSEPEVAASEPAEVPGKPEPLLEPSLPEAPAMPQSMEELAEMVGDAHEFEEQKKLMELILEFRHNHKIQEIWLGPFLRQMDDAFPYKSNADRKSLLNRLCKTGAVRIEDRPRSDEGGTYAVLIVKWDHPLVIEMNPG